MDKPDLSNYSPNNPALLYAEYVLIIYKGWPFEDNFWVGVKEAADYCEEEVDETINNRV